MGLGLWWCELRSEEWGVSVWVTVCDVGCGKTHVSWGWGTFHTAVWKVSPTAHMAEGWKLSHDRVESFTHSSHGWCQGHCIVSCRGLASEVEGLGRGFWGLGLFHTTVWKFLHGPCSSAWALGQNFHTTVWKFSLSLVQEGGLLRTIRACTF